MPEATDETREPAALSPGDHACWAFGGADSWRETIAAYLSAGRFAGERLLLLGTPQRTGEALDALDAQGVDTAALRADGALLVGDAESAYLPDGVFDADARIAAYERLVRDALADGFTGLRVAADVPPALREMTASGAWPSYELRADLLAARLPFTALCCYDRQWWAPDDVAPIASVHALAFGLDGAADHCGFRVHGVPDGAIALDGELDMAGSALLGRLLAGSGQVARALLDVSRLRFVDVIGIRAVADAAIALAERTGSPVVIRGASPTFVRLWGLLRLQDECRVEMAA